MKKTILLAALMGFGIIQGFAQNKFGDKVYSVGFGVANENNVSNFGIYVSNDVRFYFSNRLSVSPRIGMFQSVGSVEPEGDFGYRSHSGVFFDLGGTFSLIKNDRLDVSLSAGPSFQVGNETYSSGWAVRDGVKVDERFVTNKLRRLGVYCDLDVSYPIKNRIHSVGLRSSAYGIYPEFLGVVYKIGFNL